MKPPNPSRNSSPTSHHPTLHVHTTQISRRTILKKWKPLPTASQDKVREILLNLRTKRAGAGGNARVPGPGKARSKRLTSGGGKVSKSAIAEAEYETAVEEVAGKYVAPSPRPMKLSTMTTLPCTAYEN